jgi:hypothetical protein
LLCFTSLRISDSDSGEMSLLSTDDEAMRSGMHLAALSLPSDVLPRKTLPNDPESSACTSVREPSSPESLHGKGEP